MYKPKKYGTVHTLVGMEPTGHYWKNIAYYLKNRGIRLCLVNPYHVNKTKELEDNSPTKNDKKDSKVIARFIYQGQYFTCMFDDELYTAIESITEKETWEDMKKRCDEIGYCLFTPKV